MFNELERNIYTVRIIRASTGKRNVRKNPATLTVTLEHPLSCYDRVEAFDIESDGSLAIPGKLRSSSQAQCTPIEVLPGRNSIVTTNSTNC